MFIILYKLVGGAKKFQKFHWSYTDIPGFSVIFFSAQLASSISLNFPKSPPKCNTDTASHSDPRAPPHALRDCWEGCGAADTVTVCRDGVRDALPLFLRPPAYLLTCVDKAKRLEPVHLCNSVQLGEPCVVELDGFSERLSGCPLVT